MRRASCLRALMLALTLAAATGPAWAQAPVVRVAAGQPADVASAARLAQLRSRVSGGGVVRLLVGTRLAPDVDAAAPASRARPAIARAASDVLARVGRRDVAARAATTLPLLVLTVDAEGLEALAADPDVVTLEEDFAAQRRLSTSVPLVQADQAWALGYRGTGWAVAILDDGVDAAHAAFGGRVVLEACFSGHGAASSSLCPNGATTQVGVGAAAPCPSCTHGTHVAGIAAGSAGVAPDASLIAVQVFSDDLLAYYSDILLAIDHVITLADTVDVAAVNLSVGSGAGMTTPCDATSPSMHAAFAALRAAGIAPVVSAGNSGASTSGLEFPGCLSSAVSVGATDDVDHVANFSNTASGMQLFAPGVGIVAPVPGGGTGSKNGTSMAAPHVAGAWVLLKQRLPSASVDAVLTSLKNSGLSIFDAGTGLSFPRIRIALAGESLAAFSVTPTTWTPPAAATSTSVTLTSLVAGATWSTSSSAGWLTVSPASGSGSATITMTASAHAASALPRTATATIAGHAVSVTQDGATSTFTLSPSTAWTPASAGEGRVVSITSSLADAAWTASTSQAWLTVSASSGTGSGTVTLTAAAHTTSGVPRAATATIAGQTMSVTQDGATPTLTIVPSTAWTPVAAGASRVVTITSSLADAPWTATSSAAWLTVSASSGTGSGAVTLTAAAHTTSVSPRTATATIAGQTVSVTQDGATPSLTISPSTVWAPGAAAATRVVTITAVPADAPWTATGSQPWVTVSASSGTGSGTVTLTAAAHTTSVSARTATVTIAGQTVAITQDGATPVFTLSPGSSLADASGGSQVLALAVAPADAPWTATVDVPWASLSPGSGTGPASLTVTIEPHTTSVSPRSVTIAVGGASAVIMQTAPSPTFSVTPLAPTAPAGGALVDVSVVSAPEGGAWTAASLADWLVVSPLQGTGSGLATVTVGARTSVSPRSGQLLIAGRVVTVTQDGAVPTFSLSRSTVGHAATGGSSVITVTASVADAPWAASSPVPWIVVSPGAGIGSREVLVTVAGHTALQARSATLTVAGRSIVVTQDAHLPTATAADETVAAPAGGGVQAMTLDVPPELPAWSAWTDVPWLTVTPRQGEGDAVVWIATLPSSSDGSGLAATGLPSPLPPGSAVVTVTQPTDQGTRSGTVVFAPAAAPGSHTRYLAEGATSAFFDTRLALLNPGDADTTATLRFLRAGQPPLDVPVSLPAHARRTVWPRTIDGLQQAEFSTVVSSPAPVVVDRTMTWDVGGYGAHAETATSAASPRWYFAEGATHSGFSLFYLLQNPGDRTITVRARFLQASGPPLERSYDLGPRSRTNIWANVEEFLGLGRALDAAEFSAVLESVDGAPFIAERAMYRSTPGRDFDAGHEAMGVAAPAPRWFLAEGRTGPFFDMFVLMANPSDVAATVRVSYLLDTGETLQRTFTAPPTSRTTVWVDQERFEGVAGLPLADAALSTTIESLNGVPLVVERAMWWPGDGATWHEAHASAGTTETGTAWALAEGEVGGASDAETYVLIANTSAVAGRARVTVMLEDGSTHARVYALAPQSRATAAIRADFGDVVGEARVGVLVEALGAQDGDPVPAIVVERAMYADAAGVHWAAGTNALATRLR